jgi:hypothetical protein
VHGAVWARSFAVAIAASRHGWRESDLRGIRDIPGIIPRISGVLFPENPVEEISPLKLAALRRAFRAHLVRRGTEDQWDFHHAQMREAVERRAALDEATQRQVHARISDYLETLPTSDAIIRVERMWQLIGERKALRAGRYYASLNENATTPEEERVGSNWTLVEWIMAGEAQQGTDTSGEANENLRWIRDWLAEPELEHEEIHRLANNLQFNLFDRLENDVVLGTRLALMNSVNQALRRLVAIDSNNMGLQRDLSVSHQKIGDVLKAQGNLSGAGFAYSRRFNIRQSLAETDPGDEEVLRGIRGRSATNYLTKKLGSDPQ